MLLHKFNRREKTMLLALTALLLIGLYVVLVHYPIERQREQIAEERDMLSLEMSIAQARTDQYDQMKRELNEIFALPSEELTVMPAYDNVQALMLDLNHIFAGTRPELSFDPIEITDGVAARTIRFSFSASSYENARFIIEQLTGTGYRCLLDSLDVSAESKNVRSGGLVVSGTITFYELVTD